MIYRKQGLVMPDILFRVTIRCTLLGCITLIRTLARYCTGGGAYCSILLTFPEIFQVFWTM